MSTFYLGKDTSSKLVGVNRTAIPHHATFLGWSLNGVDTPLPNIKAHPDILKEDGQ